MSPLTSIPTSVMHHRRPQLSVSTFVVMKPSEAAMAMCNAPSRAKSDLTVKGLRHARSRTM